MVATARAETELARVTGFPAAGGPLDLAVHHGDVVLLAGPNGSGKTSLLRALAGLDAPLHAGSCLVGGSAARATPADRLAAGLLFQDPRDGLVGLTVQGEFDLRGVALPASVGRLAGRDTATLSSGEARKVAHAAATAPGRTLLLLDEPVEGLDAAARDALRGAIREHATRGAVVLSDHSGALADLATKRVDLGSRPSAPLPSIPSPAERHRLRRGPLPVRRGDADVPLPAVDLPSGVHALVGRNGGGKSTLLLALAGLLGHGATATLDGAPPAAARLLLPRARLMLWRERVDDHLAGCDAAVVDALVPPGLRSRSPLALSGGEAQRVALAATLGRPAPLVLLDEPEAHLDDAGRAALAAILARRAAEGAVLVAATHDPQLQALAHTRTEVGA